MARSIRKAIENLVDNARLSQTEFCEATGLDMATVNNYVARGILTPTEIGGRQVKGTRLYSMSKTYEGRIIAELVQHKIPPSDAAKIASVATDVVFAWRPDPYMVVAWLNGRLSCQMISDKKGQPDFSNKAIVRFLSHPFIVLPITNILSDVLDKCFSVLRSRKDQFG